MGVFNFASREVKIQFFDKQPIEITVFLGDEFDGRLLESAKEIKTADGIADLNKRRETYMKALQLLIGEKADKIMERAEPADSLAVMAVYMHISAAYADAKRKNLNASVNR